MQTVNVWHIGNFLGYLLILEVSEFDRLSALESDNKVAMRELFAARLVPAYQALPLHGQRILRRSLQYFLVNRSAVVGDMIAALQDLPISAEDSYPALEALWDALFPVETYVGADLSGYVEDNDSATGNEISAPLGGWPEGTA
jgi:hypothetical protein